MGPRLRDSASWPRGRLHAPYGPPILPSLHVPLLHRHLCSNVKDYLNRDQVVDYKGEKFPRVLAWKMAWDSFFILWKLPLPLGGAGSTRYKRYHSHFRNVAVATLKWKYFSKPLHQIASFDQLMKLDQSDCLFWTSSEHCGWYKLASNQQCRFLSQEVRENRSTLVALPRVFPLSDANFELLLKNLHTWVYYAVSLVSRINLSHSFLGQLGTNFFPFFFVYLRESQAIFQAIILANISLPESTTMGS